MPTLAEVAADLYARLPGEMIAARDARARELRAAGDEGLAAQVTRLRKPSTAAWAVNHLAHTDPGQLDEVVHLGGVLRESQAGLDGGRLRELARERRRLTAAVAARARDLAAEAGVPVSESVAAQVEATLTAAMIDDDAGRAVRSGLLVGPLEATGLGGADVASAVAVPDALGLAPPGEDGHARHLRAVPDLPASSREAKGAAPSGAARRRDAARAEAEEARARARQDLADAEDDVAAARDAGSAAAAEVGRVEAVAGRVDAERQALHRRLAELDDQAAAVDAELRGAVVARQRAERTLADATRRRDEAAARLRDLG
ncbi:hypothetical protein [Isoptericola sp. BMS4]|uniref:hypothetical protein n=1 Tax=Isoptericola sp. BMS4 TaxID=2527875 RepID=UPI001420FED6|nr:hypothetical protein [Isoptericola sp. BMS4]